MFCFGAPPLVAVKSATVNGRSVSSFSACPFLGCDRRGSANSKGNRPSPLYVICLDWVHEIQFVDFDSKLFYGRHCQIEPDGEHPTSIERNSRITSLCARQRRALCIHTLLFIVPMPSTINSTNFSSLVSTALFPESNRRRWSRSVRPRGV